MSYTLPMPTSPNQVITTTIDSNVYNLHYRFNERDSRWYLDIYNNSKILIYGVKIVEDTSLIKGYNLSPLNGFLFCAKMKNDSNLITYDNFGQDKSYILMYISEEELKEWVS